MSTGSDVVSELLLSVVGTVSLVIKLHLTKQNHIRYLFTALVDTYGQCYILQILKQTVLVTKTILNLHDILTLFDCHLIGKKLLLQDSRGSRSNHSFPQRTQTAIIDSFHQSLFQPISCQAFQLADH